MGPIGAIVPDPTRGNVTLKQYRRHDTNYGCILVLAKASLLVHTEAKPNLQAAFDQLLRSALFANPTG